MKITLVTDSTCDIQPAELAKRGIRFAPLKVLFKDAEYTDKIDITNPDFYELMKKSPTLPTTSQVNPGAFQEIFSDEVEKGHLVLGLFISSELSGTYNSAVIARDMVASNQIVLVDSRTTSFGLGLLVNKAQDLIDAGYGIDAIVKVLNDRIQKSQLYGMLDTLENLKKGGRLSSSSAMIGKMLNLKPIIQVENGLVNVASKARGSKKGYTWMLEQLKTEYPSGEVEEIGLAYANNREKLDEFQALLKAQFNIKKTYVSEIGSVVGTHTGEGAVGIVFYRQ